MVMVYGLRLLHNVYTAAFHRHDTISWNISIFFFFKCFFQLPIKWWFFFIPKPIIAVLTVSFSRHYHLYEISNRHNKHILKRDIFTFSAACCRSPVYIYFLEYLLLYESCFTKYTCNFAASLRNIGVSVAINNQSLLGRSRRCLR